jgi:hypothetical protein
MSDVSSRSLLLVLSWNLSLEIVENYEYVDQDFRFIFRDFKEAYSEKKSCPIAIHGKHNYIFLQIIHIINLN